MSEVQGFHSHGKGRILLCRRFRDVHVRTESTRMSTLPTGKLDAQFLSRLLTRYTQAGDRVVLSAGIGEDAAVIDMDSHYLIAKTDPITHVTGEIGHYVVNINANDIAAMGGMPRWFLLTVLLPEGSSATDVERMFSQVADSCRKMGVSYCGGHTEVSSAVSRPVVVGQMLGEVDKERLKPSSQARAGDDVLMTKTAAIEATAIIAREKAAELGAHVPAATIRRAQEYLHDPGISVVREAAVAAGFPEVHALHDPTEGGVATGVFEMATASGLGVTISYEQVPVSGETRRLCDLFRVEPLGTFASGALLMAVAPKASARVTAALAAEGIGCSRIGVFTNREQGLNLVRDGQTGVLPVYDQDELSKIFG